MRQSWCRAAEILGTLLALVGPTVGTVSASAQTVLEVGYSNTRPPYVMMDFRSGIEVEMVREATRRMGVRFEPVVVPNTRVMVLFQQGALDMVTLATPKAFPDAVLSKPYLFFQNMAIARREDDLQIAALADLAGLRVIAFQNAKRLLGPAFRAALANTTSYAEVADQSRQVVMLSIRRADAVIADRRVFQWYNQAVGRLHGVGSAVRAEFFPVFPPTQYSAGFKSRALRDAFDQAIVDMRADGTYETILAHDYATGLPPTH